MATDINLIFRGKILVKMSRYKTKFIVEKWKWLFVSSLSANMVNIKYTFVGYLLRAWLYILNLIPKRRRHHAIFLFSPSTWNDDYTFFTSLVARQQNEEEKRTSTPSCLFIIPHEKIFCQKHQVPNGHPDHDEWDGSFVRCREREKVHH